MARKKAHAEHENHERWLISYADFITLLFAFFVVMFASSQVDKKKAQQVSQSVQTALEQGAQASAQRYVPRGIETEKGKGGSEPVADKPDSRKAPQGELMPSLKLLNEALEHEISTGKIELHMEARGLVVSLHEGGFFESGDDKVIPGSFPAIAKIAAVVQDLPNPVRLEGHTDSVPIHSERFDSNWELSAARAIAMLNLMATKYSIPRSRCAIAGYAETMPVDSNKTAAGRARNRRVDVVILNDQTLVDAKLNPPPLPPQAAPPAPATPQKPSPIATPQKPAPKQ